MYSTPVSLIEDNGILQATRPANTGRNKSPRGPGTQISSRAHMILRTLSQASCPISRESCVCCEKQLPLELFNEFYFLRQIVDEASLIYREVRPASSRQLPLVR